MDEHHPTFERVERTAGTTLAIRGELDLATVSDLRRELHALLAEASPLAYLDLSGVTFLDSSSIAALVEARRRARSQGSDLIVVSPSRVCRRVFDILGLADVLGVRDPLLDG